MDVAARFRDEIVSRGAFSQDWFSAHIPAWEEALAPLECRNAEALELGVFEGMATCFMLWRYPATRITCVDSFTNWHDTPDLQRRFERNVALVDASRVRTIRGKTEKVLPVLIEEDVRFDFIYVDASHMALDVLVDAAHSWRLLAPGGLIIFDDYGLDYHDALLSPTVAIDAFLRVIGSGGERLTVGRQYALRKVDPATATSRRSLRRPVTQRRRATAAVSERGY